MQYEENVLFIEDTANLFLNKIAQRAKNNSSDSRLSVKTLEINQKSFFISSFDLPICRLSIFHANISILFIFFISGFFGFLVAKIVCVQSALGRLKIDDRLLCQFTFFSLLPS